MYAHMTCAWTIIKCAIVHNVSHVTSAWKLISLSNNLDEPKISPTKFRYWRGTQRLAEIRRAKKNTFARRRLSTRRGTQGQSRGALSPMPLHPHPSKVPPATQVGGNSTYGELESRRGHWSTSTGVFRWKSPPDGQRVIIR